LRIPIATYRLQFGNGFGFCEAAALAPYLRSLGISDVYASPIFKAKSGSCSGYDVTDPLRVNPELGGETAFRDFLATLKQHDLGLILDIVPNHMAADPENAWWMDVLENGACSPHAFYFDINWDSSLEAADDRVLLPILGSPYGTALENGELRLAIDARGLHVLYFDRRLPLDPKTYGAVIGHRVDGGTFVALRELLVIVDGLPPRTVSDKAQVEQRYAESAILKQRLWAAYSSETSTGGSVRAFLDENIRLFNGAKGDPRSFDLLDALLSQQPYAMSYWRVAREKINYRRFFDISDLVAIRTEDPEVFAHTHALVLQLLEEGSATGVRVDHIDGLNDPHGYLARFKDHAPDRYLVIEKILCGHETLPADWPVCGDTGYEFAATLNSVLVDAAGLSELGAVYSRFTKQEADFATVVYESKKQVMSLMFAGEVLSLSLQLGLLADHDRHGRDLSPEALRRALEEITACLPVYRTYVRTLEVGADRAVIESAVKEAQRRAADVPEPVYAFVRRVLLLEFPALLDAEARMAWQRFVRRWQQFTGPVMAKGSEDTACYVYNRLVSLNEVGGSAAAATVEEFHNFNAARQRSWPLTMNATSTHDTKRSEDVRARIHLLSEMPAAWERRLRQWRKWNARRKPVVDGVPAPLPNDEILIYQTLVGAWPLDETESDAFRDRLQAYIQKALREAKVVTSWNRPDTAYENAVERFVGAILQSNGENRFLHDFLAFQQRIAFFGSLQSLTQTLLRLASPGVPDTYQGTEVWNFSLVDPDNRRPVNFAALEEKLSALPSMGLPCLLKNWGDGAMKLFLVQKTLEQRHARPEVFSAGDYLPLTATGKRKDHVIAFARHAGAQWIIAAAPRLLTKLSSLAKAPLGGRVWYDTELPLPQNAPRRWRNVLTDEVVKIPEARRMPLAAILKRFPVALLAASQD